MTSRRRLIAGIISSFSALCLCVSSRALAQTRPMPRVGFVLTTAPLPTMAGAEPEETVMRGFVHGLRSLGYVETKNIIIERRSAEGNLDRLEGLIRELAGMPVDVLVVTGNHMTLVAKKVTSTVPIVVAGMSQPVELGIVHSVSRPGGNIAGLFSAIATPAFYTKRLEIIREILPKASRIAFLGVEEDGRTEATDAVHGAAKTIGLRLVPVTVEMPRIQTAIELLERDRPDALLVSASPPFFVHRGLITDFARRARVPDFHAYSQAVEAGA